MSTIRPHRTWREPPIVLQILVLLFGGLVVAQIVTLMLTMVVPPSPPVQHDMRDIVSALRSAEDAGGLTRSVQAGPPDVSGAGWFTSSEARDSLAKLLGRSADDVRLAFYAPLPFAGVAAAPPQTRLSIETAHPAGTVTAQPIAWTVDPEPLLPRSEQLLRLVAGPPGGGGYPGGSGGNGMPGGGFQGRDFPGEGYPRQGSPNGSGRMDGNGRRGGMSNGAPGGGGAIGRDLGGRGYTPSPGDLDRQPVGPYRPDGDQPGSMGRGDDRGAFGPHPGERDAGAMPGLAAPSVVGRDFAPILPPSASAPATATATATGNEASPRPIVPPQAKPTIVPHTSASPSVAAPQPDRPLQAVAPSATLPAVSSPDREAAPSAAPLPIRPQGKALFGLAPAPFVEGDFVAAVRGDDGRWTVVQPAADGFPNAWQRRVLLWFVVAFAIVAPIGWLYARHIVRPLARFTTAAEQLGRDPSAALVALEGPAEIGRAAHAFNVMQSRLRSFVDDRTAMVGAISHDLRTPLTRLRFRIEEVEDDAIRDGMNEEVAEMEAMITSALTFIRDASTPNARERLDLGMLVEDVAQDAQLIGSDVKVEMLAPAPVEIDVLGMRRLLANLVENAVKYGDRARIRMRVEEDAAIAEIEDDGPGIPEDELERAFEPFYRASNAAGSGKSGTGLGLAVCRSIARAHGGDVVLVRSADGFAAQLRLPLAYDAARMAA
ncbi:HAMP domain-containing protein [Sphingomonas sp. CGMCC 1.13654]|uniref:histidine kinase n=1 Tax=Sphingomonas chungangi TaxID=2683589 RepID=A0A838LB12_9SPHN|nr:ATP-binding protein [Sphingomonas chungangi]MBA2935895.1 HAMP domain-containing protein [Sphingomonas chungangi]MVW54586.1 HAMP domain-containing protein [Sphingomonas chungangi]